MLHDVWFWLFWALIFIAVNAGYTYPKIRRSYRVAHYSTIHIGEYFLGDSKKPKLRILVLGDSGASGQGIKRFEDSAGGNFALRFAKDHHVHYVNHAGMGKWAADVYNENVKGSWDIIALVLGSNDLLHGADFDLFQDTLNKLIEALHQDTKALIVAGPGEISRARIFPWWYRRILRRRQKRYEQAIAQVCQKYEAAYFDPLREPEIFNDLGKDGLHLGPRGNKLLADALWGQWQKASPFVKITPE